MELLATRTTKTDTTSIGDFYINGDRYCNVLQPTDRGLTSDMSLDEIASIKIQDQTAIPTGRFQVVSYFSPKHNMNVPLLLGVPGYGFVEIHVGNFAKDTDGCLLLGMGVAPDAVTESQVAVDGFYRQFFQALAAGEAVYITIQDGANQN